MDKDSKWESFPHIVEWVSQMNQWAKDFQIYEFVPADADGLDPSGRIPIDNVPDTGAQGSIEKQFIWTLTDPPGDATQWVSTFFMSAHWQVLGWYIGRVSHNDENINLMAGVYACNGCRGEGRWWDSEGDEVECEACDGGETSEWVQLKDTAFSLVS